MARSLNEVMTRNPECARENDDLQKIARMMKQHDTGVIPICDDSHTLQGLVTDRDIVVRLIAEGKNPSDAKVSEIMSRNVRTVRENESVEQVFDLMSREQIRRVPVVSDDGKLVGIVSQADLATKTDQDRKVGRTVEEISEPRREQRT